ncbi:MAG: YlbF family regulator [Nanobdellota archaeon]
MMNDEVIRLAEEFAEEIAESTEYKDYKAADKAFKDNQDSIDLMNEFNQKREEIKYDGVSESKKIEIEKIQKRIRGDKTIQNFLRAQDRFVKLLRETNNIISEEIDSPFAYSKGGGGCGCG